MATKNAPNPPTLHRVDAVFRVGPIAWDRRRGEPFRRCSYCGGLHPEDLAAALAAGASLEAADRKYGWPHKFYVHGIPNPDQAMLFCTGSVSGGLSPPTAEELRSRGYTPVAELTDAQRAACVRDGVNLAGCHGVQLATRATLEAKFYTLHMAEPWLDKLVRATLEQATGYSFRVEGDDIVWKSLPRGPGPEPGS